MSLYSYLLLTWSETSGLKTLGKQQVGMLGQGRPSQLFWRLSIQMSDNWKHMEVFVLGQMSYCDASMVFLSGSQTFESKTWPYHYHKELCCLNMPVLWKAHFLFWKCFRPEGLLYGERKKESYSLLRLLIKISLFKIGRASCRERV